MCEATTQPHLTKQKAHQSDLTLDRLLNTHLLIGVDYKTIENHGFCVKVMFNWHLLPISSRTALLRLEVIVALSIVFTSSNNFNKINHHYNWMTN